MYINSGEQACVQSHTPPNATAMELEEAAEEEEDEEPPFATRWAASRFHFDLAAFHSCEGKALQ